MALEQRGEARRVAQEQVGALVGRGAAGEADGQRLGIEADAGARADLGQQLALERALGGPQPLVVADGPSSFVKGCGDRLVPPGWNCSLKETCSAVKSSP